MTRDKVQNEFNKATRVFTEFNGSEMELFSKGQFIDGKSFINDLGRHNLIEFGKQFTGSNSLRILYESGMVEDKPDIARLIDECNQLNYLKERMDSIL